MVQRTATYAFHWIDRKVIQAALCGCMLLLMSATGCSKAQTDAITMVNHGVRALNRGDVETANGYFKRAARLDPENAAAHYQQGLIAVAHKDDPKAAVSHFERALTLDQRHVEVLYQLGRLHTELGDHAKAAELLGRALETDPNHAGAWHYKGLALLAGDNKQGADLAWRESVAIDPGRSRSFLSLGAMYESVHADEAARAVYMEGLAHNRGDASLLNSLGVLELRFREIESSIEHLNEALSRDAARTDTLFNLSFAFAEAGRRRDAVRHLNAFLNRADPIEEKDSMRVARALKDSLLAEGL
ncbi:MAG: tetratricopeptide repeat protein [Myxococcota bacterium]